MAYEHATEARVQQLPESLYCVQRLDMVKELTKLKVIHVAGTKGKVTLSHHDVFLTLECVLASCTAFCPAGFHLCYGGEHAATMRLQNWLVHFSTLGRCPGENTISRVSHLQHLAVLLECLVSAYSVTCQGILVLSHKRLLLCRRPIAKELFIQHFWWCFNKLKEFEHMHPGMPAYFRFMTILG